MIYLDTGCLVKLCYPERSLDIMHCAAAKVLASPEFVTTDVRQRKLAEAMGLNAVLF